MICKLCSRTDIKSKKLKLCSIHYAKDYRQRNKERIRPVTQANYLKNRDQRLKSSHAWRKNNMKRVNVLRKRYDDNHKEMNTIRKRTHSCFNHLKKGSVCNVCKVDGKLEFHHIPPYRHDRFIIVCHTCHRLVEGRLAHVTDEQKILLKKAIKLIKRIEAKDYSFTVLGGQNG